MHVGDKLLPEDPNMAHGSSKSNQPQRTYVLTVSGDVVVFASLDVLASL